ncbi:MAG: hypothetical protein ACOCWQ_06415 [Nanoarchaeota archaeon]
MLNAYFRAFKRAVHQLPEGMYRDALSSVGETMRYNKYLKALKQSAMPERLTD